MQESDKISLPSKLLNLVSWNFGGSPYPDRTAFIAAVRDRQRDEQRWKPDEIALRCNRARIQYMCWQDGEQVEPVLELRSDDGVAFTAAELLHKIHDGLAGANLGDHRFFEGLYLHSQPAPGEAPLYWVRLGS